MYLLNEFKKWLWWSARQTDPVITYRIYWTFFFNFEEKKDNIPQPGGIQPLDL